MDQPTVSIKGISKRFGGVRALTDVSFEAAAGEVLGLIGENGAGKSTLVKILTGIHVPDSGTISCAGQACEFSGPQDAAAAGISAIQQEPTMFDELSVAENIFVGAQPRTPNLKRVDWRQMRLEASRLLAEIGVDLDPDLPLRNLSVAERHLVSLARALSTDARLIIFDEPTAALSQSEIQHLYGIIERLREQGKAIIFISHKFDEIFRICDRFVVLRDGSKVGSGRISDTDQAGLIRMMVGRELTEIYPKAEAEIGGTILSVTGFSHPTEFDDISFDLRRGEVLGFYGLVGAGRTELMEAIFGLKTRSAGELSIDGRPISIRSPRQAMAAGLAYVPEDRQRHGGILGFSIGANLSLPILDRLSRWGLLSARREEALANEYGRKIEVKAANWAQKLEELSGGNQQKVVLGKWLATQPRIVILDEPTKGIDVGTKSSVHRLIGDLVRQGLSVIMVSSELEEVLGMADRMVVMSRGKISAILDRGDFSQDAVMAAAAGLKPNAGNRRAS
ncbi:MAG TPA: sugar ABC transporter ATP-binding protein [Devosiaceae bacterium]